jgi:hypothetical protein
MGLKHWSWVCGAGRPAPRAGIGSSRLGKSVYEQQAQQLQQARHNRPRSRYDACGQSIAKKGAVK